MSGIQIGRPIAYVAHRSSDQQAHQYQVLASFIAVGPDYPRAQVGLDSMEISYSDAFFEEGPAHVYWPAAWFLVHEAQDNQLYLK